ncbi:MAG: hypothetical protein GY830_01935 [Bacteroidetes bacterium]|nr:hypothetical protein [Bacteroidota bacterium]
MNQENYKILNVIKMFSKKNLRKDTIRNTEIISSFIFLIILACSNLKETKKIKQVFIKNPNSKSLILDINKNEKTIYLKNKIYDIWGFDPENILLVKNSKILEDDIDIFNVLENFSCIDIHFEIKGGDVFFEFVNFEKENQVTKKFSNTAPSWRTIKHGINLEASCHNCNIDVWCNLKSRSGKNKTRYKGSFDPNYDGDIEDQFEDGAFNILNLMGFCHCPKCENKIEEKNIFNFGFYNCKFHILGKYYDSRELIENLNNISEIKDKGFVTFNKNKIEKCSFIQVIVEKV